MRLTTKGRFAVTAMLDIGLRQSAGPVTLVAIAERQQISLSYLEQLFAKLRRNSLVESTRGPGGGYSLSREPDLISVADIIGAVDESVDVTCGGQGSCATGGSMCLTHDLWTSLNDHMMGFLDNIHLKKLMDEQLANGWSADGKASTNKVKRVAAPVFKRPRVPNSVFALGNAWAAPVAHDSE